LLTQIVVSGAERAKCSVAPLTLAEFLKNSFFGEYPHLHYLASDDEQNRHDLNKLGAGKFRAYSAGSQPKGYVHPEALRLLQSLSYDVSGFRSKSWSEFADPGAPLLDFVFTVCDNAAGGLPSLAGTAHDCALGFA